MSGTVLLKGGLEKLRHYSHRLSGNWTRRVERAYGGPRRTFPEVLLPDALNERRGYLSSLGGWPCWLTATCGLLHEWPVGEPNRADEEPAAFDWAMRVAGLLERPIDYERVRDRCLVEMLRLMAEFEPKDHALMMAAILDAKLRGERYGYDLANAMLGAYERLARVTLFRDEWSVRKLEMPDDAPPIKELGESPESAIAAWTALAYLRAGDIMRSILESAWDEALSHSELYDSMEDDDDLSDAMNVTAAPFVARGRWLCSKRCANRRYGDADTSPLSGRSAKDRTAGTASRSSGKNWRRI